MNLFSVKNEILLSAKRPEDGSSQTLPIQSGGTGQAAQIQVIRSRDVIAATGASRFIFNYICLIIYIYICSSLNTLRLLDINKLCMLTESLSWYTVICSSVFTLFGENYNNFSGDSCEHNGAKKQQTLIIFLGTE